MKPGAAGLDSYRESLGRHGEAGLISVTWSDEWQPWTWFYYTTNLMFLVENFVEIRANFW
jgi:hypothetical protein